MPTWGLTDDGFIAPRAADLLTIIRDDFEARSGIDVDWEEDLVLGTLTASMAAQLGDLAEGLQALYDSFDVNNATGLALDNLCQIVGVTRDPSTAGSVTLTLTGTTGTVIPAGSLVEGGTSDTAARWETSESVTLSGGTGSVVATCTTRGRITADAGTVTKIVTPVSGWSAVTNAAAATPGVERETDTDLRARRAESLSVAGTTSVAALRTALLALDFVTAAVVLENATDADVTTSGVAIDAYGVAVILYPSTLTTAQKEQVATTMFAKIAAGTPLMGAVTATVTKADGATHTLRWAWATTTAVNVAVQVTAFDTGYVLADVQDAIEAAITTYFAGLTVGAAARRLDIFAALAAIPGVAAVALSLNSGSTDITPNLNVLLTEGTVTIT